MSDITSVSPLVVLHHREAGQEASHDRGFCNDGDLQCWNHINPNSTGVCVCARVFPKSIVTQTIPVQGDMVVVKEAMSRAMTSSCYTIFFSPQAHLSVMRYISVCCVVGIIAGFCIGPGKLLYTIY